MVIIVSAAAKFGAPFLIIGILIGLGIGFFVFPQQAQQQPAAPAPGAETVTVTETKTVTETRTVTAEAAKPMYRWNVKLSTTGGYFEANLPVLVALAKGYFDEEGINVELIIVKGGSEARKQLIAGDVDFIAQSSVHAGIAISAGADIKLVVPTFRLSTVGICVTSELKDEVKDIADLKGKAIGITRFGSLTWTMANYYLSKAGLDPEKDVTIVEIGSDLAAIVAALQQGKIQAYMCWTPVIYKLTTEGIAYTLVNPLDVEQHRKWIGESSLEAGIITRTDVIEKDPELVMRFVSAIKKALLYITTSSAEDVARTLINSDRVKQYVGYSEEDLVKIIRLLKPGYNQFGLPDPMSWDTGPYVKLQQALPDKFKPVSFEQAVDWRFSGLAGVR